MSFHDETPTSELPVVREPSPGARRRLGAFVLSKRFFSTRIGIVAMATVATLGVAGIALGAAGTSSGGHASTTSAGQYASLPNQTAPTQPAPTRVAPSRASRGSDRPAPPTTTTKPKTPAWVAPMKRFHINSCYGMRWGRIHQGIDFAVSPGAPIFAAHAGVVVIAGYNSGGYGNMVLIKHGPHLFTLYGHASKVLVHAGQKVSAGQKIALEGATGHVTGPHMHFEVWTAMWQRIEPGAFLAKQGIHLSRCQ